MNEKRIISLIPSATEIVAALGFEANLVGRSHECDFPHRVKDLPVVTEPKFHPGGSSRDIDNAVKDILKNALSVYRVHENILQALQPHLIVTQSHCEVCAVNFTDVEQAVCQVLGEGAAQIVSLEPNKLDDVWADFLKVAQALDVPERGQALVADVQRSMKSIAEKTATLANKPRVACIEWIDPLMAAGNWMPELVEMAGGINLFGETGHHSPWMTFDSIAAADPDIIVVLPCGFSIPRAIEDMPALTLLPAWSNLKAVQSGQVYITDGHHFFNRPGPRLVDSLEILAEIFHPEIFNFGHHGTGWQKFNN